MFTTSFLILSDTEENMIAKAKKQWRLSVGICEDAQAKICEVVGNETRIEMTCNDEKHDHIGELLET